MPIQDPFKRHGRFMVIHHFPIILHFLENKGSPGILNNISFASPEIALSLGDTFFTPFEDKFTLMEEVKDAPEFKILHYRNLTLKQLP